MEGQEQNHLIKWASLCVMVVQSCSLVLLMRYTKSQDGDTYFTSSAVIMAEIVKIAACVAVIFYNEGKIFNFSHLIWRGGLVDTLQICVPAVLYSIQNNLLYYGLEHLQVPHYQVLYQFKVLTTAVFSVIFLGTRLSSFKWSALGLLTVGVICIQLDINSDAARKELDTSSVVKGSAATLLATVTSGLSGAYFEKVLKGTPTTLWVRNIQLGTIGLISSIAIALLDYDLIAEKGFFYQWDYLTICVVLNQAIGGLVVALVVKYADSIVKGFAVSISIIINSIISIMFFDFVAHYLFFAGTAFVLSSVYMYSL